MRTFFDTNILVYAFTTDPRSEAARACLAAGGSIAVQSLNEFAAVARRKLKMSWPELRASVHNLRRLCWVVPPLDLGMHRRGLAIAERYELGVFDAMLIASAIEAGCETLLSEDMHDGLVVGGALTIRNPFA